MDHGDLLATAGADRTARIWDAETGAALHVLKGHTAGLTRAALSPDGCYLSTGQESTTDPTNEAGDTSVRIWEVETGRELMTIQTSQGGITWGLAFSPDGRYLATSGGDANARLWSLDLEASLAELLATLTNHATTVVRVRFSPDGQLLATASFDEVRLWDHSTLARATGDSSIQELLVLPGGPGVIFSRDGSELITDGEEGVVHVYLFDSSELLDFARTRLTRWWTAEECRQHLHIPDCPPEPNQ